MNNCPKRSSADMVLNTLSIHLLSFALYTYGSLECSDATDKKIIEGKRNSTKTFFNIVGFVNNKAILIRL
jgi:hypothetical protein